MTNTFTQYSFENGSTALYNEANLSKIKAAQERLKPVIFLTRRDFSLRVYFFCLALKAVLSLATKYFQKIIENQNLLFQPD